MSVISLTERGVYIHGKSVVLLCSSLFYFRLPRNRWEERIRTLKGLGYNTMDVYFPWNFHETRPGYFDFSGEKDVDAFLALCQKYGMYVIARPGPYICSEWNGGGLPSWICSEKNIRQNDSGYLKAAYAWYDRILPFICKYQLTENSSGGVIMMQLDNELDFFDCSDVDGMIGALRDKALACGITVPLFCCAGQGDIEKAGGCVDGVVSTYNFYPDIHDENFDANCREYANALARKRSLPLLVSETGREHSLLKRELMAGAKLLGAYNQVAGSNFGYYQAINNWGAPEAIITTKYDFNSMISTLGDCTKEADEAMLFSSMLETYGESLGTAVPSEYPLKLTASFKMPAAFNALKNETGEMFLSVVNLTEKNGTAQILFHGEEISLEVGALSCLILPKDVRIGRHHILFSNYEVVYADETQMVFCGCGTPCLFLKTERGETLRLTDSGVYDGVQVRLLSKAEAVAWLKNRKKIEIAYTDAHETRDGFSCERGVLTEEGDYKETSSLILTDNEIWFGGMDIRIPAQPSNELFLENVSDFLTVIGGQGESEGALYGGESVLLPPSEEDYRLRVEAWGHCNFDDPRTRSLRIGSFRGIKEAYTVVERRELPVWRFTTYSEWMPAVLNYRESEFHARLSLNSWNSTRVPLIGLYYTDLEKKASEKVMIRICGGQAETALYVNGKLVGEFHIHDKLLDITSYVDADGARIELLVRKREWTQPVGTAEVLYLNKTHYKIRPFDEEKMQNARSAVKRHDAFPITMQAGSTEVLEIDLGEVSERDCYGVVSGKGYKLTAVYGGKVIARMVGELPGICQQGGSDTQFLIPSQNKGGELKFIVEALRDTRLDFAVEYNKNI